LTRALRHVSSVRESSDLLFGARVDPCAIAEIKELREHRADLGRVLAQVDEPRDLLGLSAGRAFVQVVEIKDPTICHVLDRCEVPRVSSVVGEVERIEVHQAALLRARAEATPALRA
jgi:hypothetical protein